jgi:hypothetical protein
MFAIADLYDDEELDAIEELPEIERIRKRYLHADCDDFALAVHVVTGWRFASVSSASKGPLHRMNVSDDGRFVDVSRYVSEEQLRKRYRSRDLSVSVCEGVDSMIDDDEALRRVVAVMPHLACQPFGGLQAAAQAWLSSGCFFDDSPPAPKSIRP